MNRIRIILRMRKRRRMRRKMKTSAFGGCKCGGLLASASLQPGRLLAWGRNTSLQLQAWDQQRTQVSPASSLTACINQQRSPGLPHLPASAAGVNGELLWPRSLIFHVPCRAVICSWQPASKHRRLGNIPPRSWHFLGGLKPEFNIAHLAVCWGSRLRCRRQRCCQCRGLCCSTALPPQSRQR